MALLIMAVCTMLLYSKQPIELPRKVATETTTPHSWYSYILIYRHNCWTLLRSSFWKYLILCNFTSSSLLRLTDQMHLALHRFHPFLINNCNMTSNSVEKHCFFVGCKMTSKTCAQNVLLTFIAFALKPLRTRLIFHESFAYLATNV